LKVLKLSDLLPYPMKLRDMLRIMQVVVCDFDSDDHFEPIPNAIAQDDHQVLILIDVPLPHDFRIFYLSFNLDVRFKVH